MIENNEEIEEQILPLGYLLADRYELVEFIGSGGMGSVYKAHDKLLEEKALAIKILHKEYSRDNDLTRRFLREVNMMHSVNHPNVVRTYDAGIHAGLFFYTMEHIEGMLLDEYVESLNKDYAMLGKITVQICKGLEAIHNQKIVHRDLKPGNIIVSNQGIVKIADFGVARPVSSGNTTHREIMGSLDYIPPEVFLGHEIVPPSDFYSLGIILYGITTGGFPFEADDPMAVVWKHVHEVPKIPSELNPEIPLWLNKLIIKLLEKEAAKRPQTAREIIRYIRKKAYSEAQLKDSAAHEVQEEESIFDTNIFEDESQDYEDSCLFDESAELMDRSSACNLLIFDEQPTVDEIKRHQDMWNDVRKNRPPTDDLKGLARKIRKVENYEKSQNRKKIFIALALIFSGLLLAILMGKLEVSALKDFNLDNLFSSKKNESILRTEKKEVSISDLREEYISGKTIDRSAVKRKEKSIFPQFGASRQAVPQNTYISPDTSVGYFQDNAAEQSNVFVDNQKSSVYVDPGNYSRATQINPQARQQARAQRVNELSYFSKSRKSQELRKVQEQRIQVKKELARLNGRVSAYGINSQEALAKRKADAEKRRQEILKARKEVQTFNRRQSQKQTLLKDVYTQVDDQTDFSKLEQLINKNKIVKKAYRDYEKSKVEFSSIRDKIRAGKVSISKADIEKIRTDADTKKKDLMLVLKSALSNSININQKKIEQDKASVEYADYLKEAQELEIKATEKQWTKITSGEAEKKEDVVQKRDALENKLEMLNKLMSDG